jgi:flagellar protein FliO/FliZ
MRILSRLSLLFISLFISIAAAHSAFAKGAATTSDPGIDRIRAYREGDLFTTELQTNAAWTGVGSEARFAGDIVEFDFDSISFGDEKQLIKVDDRLFRSVYVTQGDKAPVRVRLSLKPGFSAASLERAVHIHKSATGITIEVTGDASKVAKGGKPESLLRHLAVVEDEGNEEFSKTKLVVNSAPAATTAAAVTVTAPVAGSATIKTSEAPVVADASVASNAASSDAAAASKTAASEAKVDMSKLPESEIPLNLGSKEVKKSEPASFSRILVSLGVFLTFLAGLTFVLKRWAAKNGTKKQNTKIKILTQHHLGPKKSLAIIQVAGEAILIGMTDQNISMLKTLSLIDDEVPEQLPGNFDHSLQNFDDEIEAPRTRTIAARAPAAISGGRERGDFNENDDFAMREISAIRDTVSGRLKNMRNF